MPSQYYQAVIQLVLCAFWQVNTAPNLHITLCGIFAYYAYFMLLEKALFYVFMQKFLPVMK